MTIQEILFWFAIGVPAYAYIGYPLLMCLWALFKRPHRKLAIEPKVSILVVAQDDAGRIRERLDNLLAMDYPSQRREVVVACDGCTDDTPALARRYKAQGVHVVEFAQRRGKAAVLNELMPRLEGDVVMLMQLNQRLDRHALRALVSNFADPRTGAVSGVLLPETRKGAPAVGEEYEDFIRSSEGRVDSTVCTTGSVFALRKRLWRKLPDDSLIEDVLIACHVVKQGYRVHYEPGARAYEEAGSSAREMLRRMRGLSDIGQLLRRESGFLNPLGNRLWFQSLSHKFLRLLCPLCLVVAFAANLSLLDDQPFYSLFFALQILFYGFAAAGLINKEPDRRNGLFDIPCAICQLNWAMVKGFARLVFGRQDMTWEKAKS